MPATQNPGALPVGKLPPSLLAKILSRLPVNDPRVLLGPGLGLDCAVVDHGDRLLVYKIEPITFVSREAGWYLVQVAANDIATTGATPRWLLVAALLPEKNTTPEIVDDLARKLGKACKSIGVSLIGGHTEVTYGIDRPILVGTMVGEVEKGRLVTPLGAQPGDQVLLTKGVPIEATAILAREFPERLAAVLSPDELVMAQNFLHAPGISVLRDAQLALSAGNITAMHDPTEGGLASALWELAEASGRSLHVDLSQVPVPEISARLCTHFAIDPLASIASGALLLTASGPDAERILEQLAQAGIACARIGYVLEGPAEVRDRGSLLEWPARDGIARLFEAG